MSISTRLKSLEQKLRPSNIEDPNFHFDEAEIKREMEENTHPQYLAILERLLTGGGHMSALLDEDLAFIIEAGERQGMKI